MKTSEMCVAQGELQTGGEKLEAPISLTPEQLETVAAGSWFRYPGLPHVWGVIPVQNLPLAPPKKIFGVIIRGPLEF